VVIRRWISALALAAVTAALLCSCSETLPLAQLPDVTKLPQKVLSKDEQQAKVNEMIAKGQSHQTQTAKEIESGK
jgi:type IV pilus biogenesis protein CpaD/CtpE